MATKRMLIDATHPEETRVVVLDGNRLAEFDFEIASKKQLKGNIYLARVTRVEPSLQAAFVEFGGNRHGFLAFNEIHPDYYRIPMSDREALDAEHDRDHDDVRHADPEHAAPAIIDVPVDEPPIDPALINVTPTESAGPIDLLPPPHLPEAPAPETIPHASDAAPELPFASPAPAPVDVAAPAMDAPPADGVPADAVPTEQVTVETATVEAGGADLPPLEEHAEPRQHHVEDLGGDTVEEAHETRRSRRPQRHYKIQEVIKRRQVLLVQVVKEERGTKGAALTTYLSLAGRYCVLMPNTERGGGISRRITSQQDRKRLKSLIEELDMPEGMAVILRTAGMERDTSDIRRDYEYLMRLWEEIRDLTLRSSAPALIYEEGTLLKRAMRDIYSADVGEILVEGKAGYEGAKSFMSMLMPSDIGKIRLYEDRTAPLFQRFQVENELDEMHQPTVRLKSGGYIVINSTEALVAIDVNSGRATRERHIDETAYKTNLEAADEVARQLRLRDLAGLIVIDFIDMDDHRHQAAVERRLKEAMKSDRARIQIGRISAFGLLELSRQRLRPSIAEMSFEVCPHCEGTGRIRSTESTGLHVLRGIEEEISKARNTGEFVVHVPASVALYLFNHKRAALADIETRHGVRLTFQADDKLISPAYRVERVRAKQGGSEAGPAPIRHVEDFTPSEPPVREREEFADARHDGEESGERDFNRRDGRGEGRNEAEGETDGERRGRRRRRRGRDRDRERGDRPQHAANGEAPQLGGEPAALQAPTGDAPVEVAPMDLVPGGTEAHRPREPRPTPNGEGGEHGESDDSRRRRRRGRRGGRRRRGEGGEGMEAGAPEAAQGQTPDAGNGNGIGNGDNAVPPAETYAPAPYRVPGPGDDLDRPGFASAPPPPRVAGPGDAHDWPWNRRVDQPAPAVNVAAPVSAPAPIVAETKPEEPAAQAAPVAPAPAAEPAPPPPEDDPNKPKRRGWWNRLTG
ncbi:MAG: Rne/Rng family ribonuclease [Alphaproteobacteria bacterium]|nr:Rne/Rng family ribonuclease [Alphaproteobacteria bacterium]